MRLARLDPSVVDLLRLAAVIGRACEPALLAQIMNIDAEQAEQMLLAAARAQVMRPDSEGAYGFIHELVRETLYDGVGSIRRRRLHQPSDGVLGIPIIAQPLRALLHRRGREHGAAAFRGKLVEDILRHGRVQRLQNVDDHGRGGERQELGRIARTAPLRLGRQRLRHVDGRASRVVDRHGRFLLIPKSTSDIVTLH